MVRSPVDICFGTSPSQAPKSRPLENAAPLPIAATIALEMTGPMPGTLISRLHAASCSASVTISLDTPLMRSSSRCQSPQRSSTIRNMRGESTSLRLARMVVIRKIDSIRPTFRQYQRRRHKGLCSLIGQQSFNFHRPKKPKCELVHIRQREPLAHYALDSAENGT